MMKSSILVVSACVLFGCAPSSTPDARQSAEGSEANHAGVDFTGAQSEVLSASVPLRRQFECLPPEAALVAAHRGVSKNAGLAENSRTSLEHLISHGTLVAEVDVAGLKDGTHILYHDGVWDDKSTGEGAVAASSWDEAQKFLLNDTSGKLTAETLITLNDALALSKDRLYLEIDFKSSAKFETVIAAIRRAGMSDRVILIAYTAAQAEKLHALAPEMLLSVGMNDIDPLIKAGVKPDVMAVWAGSGPYDLTELSRLKSRVPYVLAWPRAGFESMSKPADLLVTDYAFDYPPIIGLSMSARQAYLECIK